MPGTTQVDGAMPEYHSNRPRGNYAALELQFSHPCYMLIAELCHGDIPVQWKNRSFIGISFIAVGNVHTQYCENADHALGFLIDTRHVVIVTIQCRDSVKHCFQTVDAIDNEILVDFNLHITGNTSAKLL